MLFEGTTFTDLPHREEWKDLAKKWPNGRAAEVAVTLRSLSKGCP